MKLLYMLFSFLWFTEFVLQIPAAEKCYQRYDMHYANPKRRGGLIPKTCSKKLEILSFEYPPYIYYDIEHNNMTGLLPGIIKEVVNVCCKGKANISYLKSVAATQFGEPNGKSSLMPILANGNINSLFEKVYVNLVEIPSVTFVTAKPRSPLEEITGKLFESIKLTWPLLVISLVICILAGIIIWFLDTWFNKRDFPRNFAVGTYEGFWWAFISMTTVGYGDKTPRSPLARIFAVLWILFGISMIGMFTATITAALSKALVDEEPKIKGKHVAVLTKALTEMSIVYREGGIPVAYPNIEQMKRGLEKREVEGVVMDNYVLQYYWPELKDGIDLKLGETIPVTGTSYGILFEEKTNDTYRWSDFMDGFFKTNEDVREIMISKTKEWLTQKLDASVFKETTETRDIFNIDVSSTSFLNALKYGGIALFGFVLVGVVLEVTRMWMKRKRLRDGGEAMLEPDFEERWEKIEDGIKDDLDKFCRSWKEQVWKEWKEASDAKEKAMNLKGRIRMKTIH